MTDALKSPWLIYGGLALVGLWLLARRGAAGGGSHSFGENIGRGAVGVVEDVFVGVVKGAGEVVGIPDTNPESCARALAEGRMWDASFDCPALDFLRGMFGVTPEGSSLLDTPGRGASGSW